MTFPVGLFRIASLLLASLVLSGCLPSAPGDEEKEPYFLAGKSRASTMDYKGAIESFEKALDVNPKSAPAHFELGLLYDTKDSDPAAAIYHYERYLKLMPHSIKEEWVKTRIVACKQQVAQTVVLLPATEKQQHEFEKLLEENKNLHDEIAQWRAYAARLRELTNQTSAVSPPMRVVQSPASGQSATGGTSLPNPAKPERAPVVPPASARTHIVKAGETPILIARKYGVKLEALKVANPKLDPRHLQVGQVLTIPAP